MGTPAALARVRGALASRPPLVRGAGEEARYTGVVAAPTGLLGVVVSGGRLRRVDLCARAGGPVPAADAVTAEVFAQLFRYFEDPAFRFDLPLEPAGTPFQRRVWAALCDIPPGQLRRYAEVASTVGSVARAVGGACRANPLPIVVPCHRVVSSGGMGGFMGATVGAPLAIKRWLLRHEGVA